MDKRNFLQATLTAAIGSAVIGKRARAQGVTQSMVKLVFLMPRRSDLSVEEFSRHWREDHAPIAAAMPGVRKYVQNHATMALDGSALAYDGFAEMWFDDMESLWQALDSPESQAALADSEKFLDVARIQTFVVEEVSVL